MPHKNSDKQQTLAVTQRRSPRFLQFLLADDEDPKTTKPEQQRKTRIPYSVSPLSSNGNLKVSPRRRSRISKSKEYSQILDDSSCNARRLTRLNFHGHECNAEKLRCSSNGQFERRVTISSCCKELNKNVEKADYGDITGYTSHGCSSGELPTEEGVGSISKQLKGKLRKNKEKASKRSRDNDVDQCDTLACDEKTSKRVLSISEKHVSDEELSEKHVDKTTHGIDVATAIVVHEAPINVRDINKMKKNIGVKRTRYQFDNTVGITQGWTKDQELALERAYQEANPTPHFWKKVSRLVPGKSAQECFDKIHGSHVTPPQPRIRSRARLSNTKNHPSLSPSKLLYSSSPTAKKPRHRKQKSHILHRTARHMLQNQYKLEQDSEADIFSALEPLITQSSNCHVMLTTPDRTQDQVLTRCQERSSTSHKQSVSRFSNMYKAPLVSPPVLKLVKNEALHEKYIDQLHCREAKRKAASAKEEMLNQRKIIQDSSVERKDAIKTAKNALVFGARDAIYEFQDQQARGLSILFDDESCADAVEDNSQVFF